MTVVMGLLLIPLTMFIIFVVPVWVWMHYRSRQSQNVQFSEPELRRIAQLTHETKRMRERIKALEDILNEQHPNWRDS